jgi:hypothetical protein
MSVILISPLSIYPLVAKFCREPVPEISLIDFQPFALCLPDRYVPKLGEVIEYK